MARDRVDILDERIRRLRAAVDALSEEHTAARERVQTVEVVLDDSSSRNGGSTPPSALADSASPVPERSEASDEDVAAAVRAIEDNSDGRFDNPRLLH